MRLPSSERTLGPGEPMGYSSPSSSPEASPMIKAKSCFAWLSLPCQSTLCRSTQLRLSSGPVLPQVHFKLISLLPDCPPFRPAGFCFALLFLLCRGVLEPSCLAQVWANPVHESTGLAYEASTDLDLLCPDH